jgi:hypothetical protein
LCLRKLGFWVNSGGCHVTAKRKEFYEILERFGSDEYLTDDSYLQVCLTKFSTKNPERLGRKLLTFSGKVYSPERCYREITGHGIGLDLMRCSDYVKLGKYLHGQHSLDLVVKQWKHDMNRYIFRFELEEEFPDWFLNTFLGNCGKNLELLEVT